MIQVAQILSMCGVAGLRDKDNPHFCSNPAQWPVAQGFERPVNAGMKFTPFATPLNALLHKGLSGDELPHVLRTCCGYDPAHTPPCNDSSCETQKKEAATDD